MALTNVALTIFISLPFLLGAAICIMESWPLAEARRPARVASRRPKEQARISRVRIQRP